MPFKECVTINNKKVGKGQPCYIVAEMSANHNKNFDNAIHIIEAAKESGADAIKLQTYTPDTLTIDCDKDYFKIKSNNAWSGKSLYQLYEEAFMPWEWQPKLKKKADAIGIDLFSTPFDFSAIEFLEKMKVPAYKVASFEIVDIPLIKAIAKTMKPIILSTGMATLSEIQEAVDAVREVGNDQLVLLKCSSAYPASLEEMNLKTISDIAGKFDVPTGLSDHTLGAVTATTAVALGACVVEKHFTISRDISGPDSTFSMEPDEFKAMVKAIRETEKVLGEVTYEVSAQENQNRIFRRSLFVVEDVKKGEVFTKKNIRSIRPGCGLHPRHLPEILGKKATRDIERGKPFDLSFIE